MVRRKKYLAHVNITESIFEVVPLIEQPEEKGVFKDADGVLYAESDLTSFREAKKEVIAELKIKRDAWINEINKARMINKKQLPELK